MIGKEVTVSVNETQQEETPDVQEAQMPEQHEIVPVAKSQEEDDLASQMHELRRLGAEPARDIKEFPRDSLNNRLNQIEDEFGVRLKSDYDWLRGNAEHSWGFLH